MANSIDKQRVLELEIDVEASKLSRQWWLEYNRDPNKTNIKLRLINYKIAERYKKYGKLWRIAMNMNQAKYKRVYRLKLRVRPMLETKKAKLLTLTFNDQALQSTNELSRRTYIREFCKKYCDSYVANRDYGKTNNREHYHAIVVSDDLDLSAWKHGSINVKRIYNNEKSVIKTSKYVAKLSLHAVKTSTKQSRLIYSR